MSDVALPELGASLKADSQSASFRVWAPRAQQAVLEIVSLSASELAREGSASLEGCSFARHPMEPSDDGTFWIEVTDVPAGTLYRFSIDGAPGRPDPRSLFQPFGVHGPSQVVDRTAYQWRDEEWKGVAKQDLVIYELHIGSFTAGGTYQSAIARLDELVDLGITAIEMLPLAQSPGKWNWGYDGVNFFAARNTFGTPDDLKHFVDQCHARGLAVFNDVVYNHVGPEGNYLSAIGPYGSTKHGTPWGDALNFDGRANGQVRQFVIDNVLFWIDEYHFDGLRLDAVHYMFDNSTTHILSSIQKEFRRYQKTIDRTTYLIGEANIYDPTLVGAPADPTKHYDAIWSDCVMHSIIAIGAPKTRLTDRHYKASDLAETLEHGYAYTYPGAKRMTPELRQAHHPELRRDYTSSLVMALQTHDSVGNHPHGKRLHHLTDVRFQTAAAPLILLYPSIPMIFMGEESAADAPFPFFADFEDAGLRKAVDRGRRQEYPHHDWKGSPLPSDSLAFTSSVITPELEQTAVKAWYRELLRFRKLGVAEGWLQPNNFSVEADVENHLYRLIYNWDDQQVQVVCRIDRADATPMEVAVYGELVLDSLAAAQRQFAADENAGNGCVVIQPRQCVIWRTV